MTIKYRLYPMQFDLKKWSDVLMRISREDVGDFALIIGVDASTLSNWIRSAYAGLPFPHPSMGHFLNTCNWLDLDPREFFSLKDE